MALSTWLPLITVALAAIGAVFAALRFNREDASAIVAQQSTVLGDMKTLNVELGEALKRIREERDELFARVTNLSEEVATCTAVATKSATHIQALETEVRGLRADLARASRVDRA